MVVSWALIKVSPKLYRFQRAILPPMTLSLSFGSRPEKTWRDNDTDQDWSFFSSEGKEFFPQHCWRQFRKGMDTSYRGGGGGGGESFHHKISIFSIQSIIMGFHKWKEGWFWILPTTLGDLWFTRTIFHGVWRPGALGTKQNLHWLTDVQGESQKI